MKNKIPSLYFKCYGNDLVKMGATCNRGGHANLRQFFNCKKYESRKQTRLWKIY